MIYITHDIDWLNPWHPLAIAKTATHGKKWLRLHQLKNRNVFLLGIDALLETNAHQNVEAIWHIGASIQSTFLPKGLRYQYSDADFNKVIQKLNEAQAEIGLHSIATETIAAQAQRLKQAIQKPINYHRSHYLNYNANLLYTQLQQCGITTDFSLGHARNININLQNTSANGVNIVPTILFDNMFFFHQPEFVFEQFKLALQHAQAHQQDVAILFHPENFLINNALHEYYQETLKIVKESNR